MSIYNNREPDPTDVLITSLLRSEPYGRKSELGIIVERRVKEAAVEIADEIVGQHAELEGRIRGMVNDSIKTLLDSSDRLQELVGEAVVAAVIKPRNPEDLR